MNNIFCDKPGHGVYPLQAYEKGGRIYVDMDSCHECGPREKEEEKPNKSILNALREISGTLDNIKWSADELKDEVDELIKEYER